MHVLYVHQNFPAQFGHVARQVAAWPGWRCTFVSRTSSQGRQEGVERVPYRVRGGATAQNHFCSRTFENAVWHCDGVYEALKARPDVRPDVIVAHSAFGSSLFLRELYPKVPVVNFFEYFYHAHNSDMDFRSDLGWPVAEQKFLRSHCRNAMILLDLNNCQLGYTPTEFQKSTLPPQYRDKLRVIFDGVDRELYHGHGEALRPPVGSRGTRRVAGVPVPGSTRVVTYVSRGFESMRGFDIFMRAANRILQQFPDVVFFVVGSDRIEYGGDAEFTGGKSFKDWVLSREEFDLSKFVFTGRIEPQQLARLLAAADLHIYLTVPFVLSWSMVDAMSCGAVVLASATTPVVEMIRDGENGLLANFFEPDEFAAKAVRVLRDPSAHRPLGRAAEQMIEQRYSLRAVLPQMRRLYEDAAARGVQ
jgi:glycosyltransferase involved in cell wall biosynthesis